MISKLWLSIPIVLFSATVLASENWLIATQHEELNASGKISIEVVKPSDVIAWPEHLTLSLTHQNQVQQVKLDLVESTHGARRSYEGVAKSAFNGIVRIALADLASNRVLVVQHSKDEKQAHLAQAAQSNKSDADEKNSVESEEESFSRIYIPEPEEDRTISANEPLYFIIGSSSERDFDARFQLSFKYRPFDPDSRIAKFIPYASNLYFAYTQTSIWDLGGESSPFKDTSYRPSIYYNWAENGKGLNPSRWKFGLEHESNGRDGEDSRSMNIVFVQPHWELNYSGGKKFTFMPRLYQYLEKSDNRDIHHYRGYVDWIARYGRDDAAILTAMYRQGTDGYGQGQFDLSYPISDKLFGRTGTFLHFQLLGGYGETLIDYNKRSDTQLRVGISLAR